MSALSNLLKKTFFIDCIVTDDDEEEPAPLTELNPDFLDRKAEEFEKDYQRRLFGDGSYSLHASRPPKQSGTRIKRAAVPPPIPAPKKRFIAPKTFTVSIKYHYPLVYFPKTLEDELKEIEKFFKIVNRGSGSTVHSGRMVSTINYRVSFDADKTQSFARTLSNVLDRYGVEVISQDIVRII